MGRPLPKRFFGADANNNIKIQFHNGTESVRGYIVRQRGSRRFLCKDENGNTALCRLVDKASADLAAGEMTATLKYDDDTVRRAIKISRHLVAVNYGGSYTQGGWTFDTSTTDGLWQFEEAGTDSAMTDATDYEGDDLSMTVTPAASSVDEAASLVFNVTASVDGTYYWTINNITTASADFSAVSGSFTVTSGTGSFTVDITDDYATEGDQTFTASVRKTSISGQVMATSTTVTITDTSQALTWTAPSGFLGYYTFNGTNQRLSMPGAADLSPGTGDFTAEVIINKGNSGGFPRLFSVGTYPSAKVACSIEGGAHVYFWINGSIAADVDCSTLAGFPAFQNNWHHLVLQRKSGKCQIYVDGNKVGSTTTGNTVNIDCSATQFDFACESAAGSTYANFLNGSITNFRWSTSAIYPNSSFPVPSVELTDLPTTQLLLTMSSLGAGLTDTGGSPAHIVTAVNSPTYHTNP